ncbi:efflux RND transporter periplasmic adaptor subunit [Salinisphaera sp. LB1]|uniref:efflux RND transporter periplasmic adaptor subunit n=1 Tax=Salinisphaera sp. LB1 TaxID=2183911 RepID=UPI000D707783|nr:efflux RND transporter periplasmic adaptor subunit [Salinisphaera sp. LB1]AWN14457.1 Cobalt/zinc/cadmium efflux RND transporter, membrane fusion protein, CzcB family [Salinisphaera sp. LB1]
MPGFSHFRATLGVLLATLWVASGCDASQSAGKTTDQPQQTATSASTSFSRHGTGHDKKHQSTPREVHLTPAQLEPLSIRVTAVPGGAAADTVKAPANVRFDADRVARVGPRLESKVVAVEADLGDRVEVGDTLAMLDSVALGKAKARYLTATAHYRNTRAAYRRKRDLAGDRIISQAALDESRARYQSARASRRAARAELKLYGLTAAQIEAIDPGDDDTPLSRFALTAPIAGTVQRRDVVTGQTVASSETPFQIVDSSRMWVMLHVAENNAARMRPGLPVSVRVRSLPNRRFAGKTDWVSRALDQDARTLTVRAVVSNADGRLSDGMFGTATVQTAGKKDYALVPADAVQTLDKDQPVVFVPGDESGHFRAVAVTTGDENNGRVEIRQGIDPGDPAVTAGAFDLMSVLTSGSRSAAHGH